MMLNVALGGPEMYPGERSIASPREAWRPSMTASSERRMCPKHPAGPATGPVTGAFFILHI